MREHTAENLKQELEQLQTNEKNLQRQIKRLKDEQKDLENNIDDLEDEISQLKKDLNNENQKVLEYKNKFEDLNQNLEHHHNIIQKQNTLLNENRLREELIGKLISAKNEDQNIQAFNNILNGDFLELANQESSLANSAEALLNLQAIEKELKMLSAFPSFFTKRTIAVAGGFSVGKSEFISSFFEKGAPKLPREINPTTAIPTYVLNDEQNKENSLIGISKEGGRVILSDIDPELTQKLSHQFMQSFQFPLKEIMPYMFLTTKLAYEHLCFVDTPGHNPADQKGGFTQDDKKIAQEYVESSDALLWLISASNGTIPASDLAFLKTLTNQKQVYFVLNKADKKPLEDLKKILNNIEEVLQENHIDYVGISAFTSLKAEELIFRKMSIFEFLDLLNTPSEKHKSLLKKLYDIDTMYRIAIEKDITQIQHLDNYVYNIGLQLSINDFKQDTEDLPEGDIIIDDTLAELQDIFSSKVKKQKENLKKLITITQSLKEIIDNIFAYNNQKNEFSQNSLWKIFSEESHKTLSKHALKGFTFLWDLLKR